MVIHSLIFRIYIQYVCPTIVKKQVLSTLFCVVVRFWSTFEYSIVDAGCCCVCTTVSYLQEYHTAQFLSIHILDVLKFKYIMSIQAVLFGKPQTQIIPSETTHSLTIHIKIPDRENNLFIRALYTVFIYNCTLCYQFFLLSYLDKAIRSFLRKIKSATNSASIICSGLIWFPF